MPIILAVLFSFVLRVINLNQSLWLDEATTALAAGLPIGEFFGGFIVSDFHPPLYYLLIKFWAIVFGTSEVSLRIPSLLFSAGSVFVSYLVAKKLYSHKAGLIAALLLATNGLAVYYAQEARAYSMAAFLAIAMVHFYLQKKWFYFAIAMALAGMTDYVVLFMLPVFWIFGYKEKRMWYSHVLLILVFTLWMPVLWKQLNAGLGVKDVLPGWWGILGTLSVKNLLLFPVKFVTGRVPLTHTPINLSAFLLAMGVYVFLVYKNFGKKFLWVWGIVPIVVGVLISFKIPTLSYFRYLFCLPAFLIMFAGSISSFKGVGRGVILTVLISLNLFMSLSYLLNSRNHRENWRDLTKFVESEKSANSITVFRSGSNMEAYYYYAPDAKITGPEGIDSEAGEVWLIGYLSGIYDPEGEDLIKLKNAGYGEGGSYDFNGLKVTRFKK